METEGDDKNLEGSLREACCFGDKNAARIFVERGVNINAKHEINGWTPLHWAAKRGHLSIVTYLLANGADKNITSLKGEKPEDLTDNESIREALGAPTKKLDDSNPDTQQNKLPIIPNYIANPPLNYKVDTLTMGPKNGEKSVENSIRNLHVNSTDKEMVIKIRVADLPLEADFIEMEMPISELSFTNFLQICCKELKVDMKKVLKVRKLPNTLVRNDKDLSRFKPFQEIELVMNYIMPQIQQHPQAGHYGNNHYNQVPIRSSSGPALHNSNSYRHSDSLMEKSAYLRNGTLLY